MVFAAELVEGEFVKHDNQVVEVISLQPVIPPEVGPDGKNKFALKFRSGDNVMDYIAMASEEFVIDTAANPTARRRAGVSSVPDEASDFKNWTKKVIPKSPEDRAILMTQVRTNMFFAHLQDEEMNDLIDVVFEKCFAQGDVLMRLGDEGDLFYILEQGEAHIFILNDKGEETMVRECKPGDSFGELALMYNAPRNATIKAITDLRCWCMDRESFKCVILGSSIKKRERYVGFVSKIKIFSTLSEGEKMKMTDALIPRKVDKDTVVVKEGDTGDMFYIVETGSVRIMQTKPDGTSEVVNEKSSGDYFGEIALMSDMPRSATIITNCETVLLTLDRATFVSLMGALESLLKRNVALYKTYVDYTSV